MSNLFAHLFDSQNRRHPRVARDRLIRFARAALPQRCELCAAPAGTALLCAACNAALPRLAASCPQCAQPSLDGAVCGACLACAPPWDAAVSALVYAFPVDRLLQHLKYGGRLALADWAAGALGDAVARSLDPQPAAHRPDRVVALPLAPERQRERGFNQAREIAARVAASLGLPLVPALRRVVSGPAQATLPWAERARNVRGAFVAERDVRGARIALVDDVMTTGATLGDAARALTRAGAARIECWVVARTLRGGNA